MVWNLTISGDTLFTRESFELLGQQYFESLVISMFDAYRNQFVNEKHLLNSTNGDAMLWTYANSIFFATTVITTIGMFNFFLLKVIQYYIDCLALATSKGKHSLFYPSIVFLCITFFRTCCKYLRVYQERS